MIHCLITREVREGKEAEFEAAIRQFFSTSVSDTNTTGAQLVTPLDGSNSRTYGILRSFPDKAASEAFYASDAFRKWSEHVAELVEGPAVRKELHGLEAFFRGAGEDKPPPTWKMALVTWVGVNLVTTPLLMVLMPLIAGTYGLPFPFDNFVFNIFVVALLSWVVMPAMVKLTGRWLHAGAPKPSVEAVPETSSKSLLGKTKDVFIKALPDEAMRDRSLTVFALFMGVTTAWLHGWPKLIGAYHYFTRGEPWRDVDLVVALGLPFPAIMATFAGFIQFFCSLSVALGWLTRLHALMVASTLVVALYWNAVEGKDNQVALLYFAGFALIAAVSSGRVSLDRFLEKRRQPAG